MFRQILGMIKMYNGTRERGALTMMDVVCKKTPIFLGANCKFPRFYRNTSSWTEAALA